MSSFRNLLISLLFFGLLCACGFMPSALGQQKGDNSGGHTRQLSKKQEKQLMKELSNPYKQWISGPISYIITPDERKAFLQLQTNGEREQFIQEFWARRDPDRGSEENTFKDQFYQRIAYANEHFASGIPGWKTDRGRIYIMWGKPDSIDSHPGGDTYQFMPQEGGGTTTTYPFEDWTYHYLPGVGENVQLEFVDTSGTGEYSLTMDPWAKDAMSRIHGGPAPGMQMTGLAGLYGSGPGNATPASMDEFKRLDLYAKIFQPPPVKFKDLEAIVTSRVIRDQLPFQYRFDFLRITDSTDLVPVTIQVPIKEMSFKEKDGVQIATLDVFGRVSTVGGRVAQTFEDTVRQDIPSSLFQKSLGGEAMYQKSMPLRPGLYRLDLVLKDVNSGNVGVISTRLPVPQYTDTTLSASTLILADTIQGVSSRNIGVGQFVLGDVMVRPRLNAVFKTNETLGFYMQVYNLKMDPKTHHSSATVDYLVTSGTKTILRQSETSAQLGDTGEQLTIEKKMPLAGLAPGSYKLQVTVSDHVAQKDVVQSADFTVKPADKSAVSEAKAQ